MRILDPAIVVMISYFFFFSGWVQPGELAKILSIYCGILVVAIFPLFNLYKSWRIERIQRELKSIAAAWLMVLVAFNTLIYMIADTEQRQILWPWGLFNEVSFLAWALVVLLVITALRIFLRAFLRAIRKHGWNQRSVIILGAGNVGKKLAVYLQQTDSLGIQVQGFFDDKLTKGTQICLDNKDRIDVLGRLDDSVEYAVQRDIDIVFITLPMRAVQKINDLVWALGLRGINVMMAPDLFAFGLQKAKVVHIGNTPVMTFNLFPGWKRAFDIVFSLFALALFSPLMLMFSFLIKMEDGGAVFYGHKRIREQGREFNCLKFRTMYMNADKKLDNLLDHTPELKKEWEKSYKLKNDPRITKIGKILRKTSLDEIPQFVNILKGEMSIVGARPVVKDELDTYYNANALTYCAMKPGLTGLWQAGKRNDVEGYDEKVELDRLYILNANPWLDMQIIFRTVWKMICGKGAY